MKKGFPRPKYFIEKTKRHPSRGSYGKKWNNKYYPHPYNASDDYPAAISQERLIQCATFKLCGTCGEPVKEELVGLIICNLRSPAFKERAWPDGSWLHSEAGPYHLKCLSLNFAMCPHLVETKQYLPAVALWTDVRAEILQKAVGR